MASQTYISLYDCGQYGSAYVLESELLRSGSTLT